MKKAFFILSVATVVASSPPRDPLPWTRISSPADGSIFSTTATVSVVGEAVIPIPDHYNSVVTNLSLFSNDALVVSQSGPSTTITANMSSLAAGSYTFYTVAKGILTFADQSQQGWSAVSAPVKVIVDPTYVGPPYVGGKIDFANRNIPTSQPNSALPGYIPGGNGNGTYHVPIYQGDGTGKVGAGLLPGGVTVGLFEVGATTPLVTSLLRTDAYAAFFATPSQTATTRSPVGSTPTLIIRAWQSSFGSFEAAKQSGYGQWHEWQFTSRPLGGTLPDGSVIATPSVTGWGPQDGSGVPMAYPEFAVRTEISSPISGSVFASPATVTVVGEAFIPALEGYFALTNLSLFANDTLLGSQSGSARLITAQTPPLAPGLYWLTVVADGYITNRLDAGTALSQTNYNPVPFQVVTPLEISVTPPQIVSGKFQFNYAANPGLKYVIKSSGNLFDWQPIVTNTPTTNPAIYSEPFDSASSRYYQVERLPNP